MSIDYDAEEAQDQSGQPDDDETFEPRNAEAPADEPSGPQNEPDPNAPADEGDDQ
jgi:hypothetical protein